MSDDKHSGFISYIDERELELVDLNAEDRTRFLNGETFVSAAQNVLLFSPMSGRKRAILGVLTVTTFKLSFSSANSNKHLVSTNYQQNRLLGHSDICLSSIDAIYHIGEKSRKKMVAGQTVPGKICDIVVVCKNMRSMEFSFKYSDRDSGKNIVTALLHHIYPKIHSLLFAYDYREPPSATNLQKEVRLFRRSDDWRRELERTKCQNWRCTLINEWYQTAHTLMSCLIVPQSVTDAILSQAIEHFQNRQCPVWVWGTYSGVALVRMADLLPSIPDRTQENTLLEHIRKSHPDKQPPYIIYLSKDGPSAKDIQNSYYKLRDLCVPDSIRTFKQQDFKFYGLLEATKWLQFVAYCLSRAHAAAEQIIDHNCTVVLQEETGQDVICVVSSLTQLLLDPYFRTKYGFQSLVQKDWVSMGHPFANRLGFILTKDVEFSPIFLLFLDCVWQLLQQFPTAFQITETYLTTVWDTAQLSVFDTFLFNCERDRYIAETGYGARCQTPLILRSAWDWSEQFPEEDIALFCNPLYDDVLQTVLRPQMSVCKMDVWQQCYFRWLPDLEIKHGGTPQIDLRNRLVVAEILQLKQQLQSGDYNGRVTVRKRPENKLLNQVHSFYPFGQFGAETPPSNNSLLSGDLSDSQPIIYRNSDQ